MKHRRTWQLNQHLVVVKAEDWEEWELLLIVVHVHAWVRFF